MTDNEIIKALECHASHTDECDDCPNVEISSSGCSEIMAENALDLINRQKAEIEKLRIQNAKLKKYFTVKIDDEKLEELFEQAADNIEINIKKVKSEAIREFAERLKKSILSQLGISTLEKTEAYHFCLDELDNIVKEMTED
ncbi:MAG: hypothetical protein IJ385_06945 [Ruminiclostridium sp.]|nr:hypothetical protein [Ruminiclostridium sp.]